MTINSDDSSGAPPPSPAHGMAAIDAAQQRAWDKAHQLGNQSRTETYAPDGQLESDRAMAFRLAGEGQTTTKHAAGEQYDSPPMHMAVGSNAPPPIAVPQYVLPQPGSPVAGIPLHNADFPPPPLVQHNALAAAIDTTSPRNINLGVESAPMPRPIPRTSSMHIHLKSSMAMRLTVAVFAGCSTVFSVVYIFYFLLFREGPDYLIPAWAWIIALVAYLVSSFTGIIGVVAGARGNRSWARMYARLCVICVVLHIGTALPLTIYVRSHLSNDLEYHGCYETAARYSEDQWTVAQCDEFRVNALAMSWFWIFPVIFLLGLLGCGMRLVMKLASKTTVVHDLSLLEPQPQLAAYNVEMGARYPNASQTPRLPVQFVSHYPTTTTTNFNV